MKRIMCLLLVGIMSLSLCGCGKNKNVIATEEAISAIGTVTYESSDSISFAENLFNTLSEKEKEKVSNREILAQAKAEYKVAEKVLPIEEAISAIGIVTYESGDSISFAEDLFNTLSEKEKEKVRNKDILTQAKAEYEVAKREKEERDMRNSVIDQISVIWDDEAVQCNIVSQNETGQIDKIKTKYHDLFISYDAGGSISYYKTTEESFLSDEVYTAEMTYGYENCIPVRTFYQDSWCEKTSDYESNLNSNGFLTELKETRTRRDKSDDSVLTVEDRRAFSFDDEGRICSVDYYTEGGSNLDHTESITYNDIGKIESIVFYGSSSGEYLSIEFTYKTINDTSVSVVDTTNVQDYFNANILLEGIL